MTAAPAHGYWHLLSLPGAAGLALPLLACAALLLAHHSSDGARAARRWLLAAAGAVTLVIACKIAFYGWGTGIRAWNLTCPSGHAVLALLLWPAFLGLLVPPHRRAWRALAITTGVLVGIGCGVSRLMIHAHPLSEVLAGLALGGLAAVLALRAVRGQRLALRRAAFAAAAVLVLGLGMAVIPIGLQAEHWFAALGARLAGREQPVQRKAWLLEGRDTPQPAEAAK
ncbi:membrane-associated phospholipid phosphatase [Lysobacter niabensis]|uniref:Membrane-associated phospholipid phosphatase n=1 Tax=Agrilutibacter niabensis TaxID=380628 RepID=A0ABU1VLF8_9GAMM|nr:phosphatase PAP2 family protein [Lysobacter niabensis]MDR7098312.1 membrane-associated phospholipid phosphatase [Lysobacter niabensis]